MKRIVVTGSLNVDLVAEVDQVPAAGETVRGRSFSTFAGGKGANQAYMAGKLDGDVSMAGRVGEDSHGTKQIARLVSVGVSVDAVRSLVGRSTGSALILVEPNGENRIIVVPGANGAFGPRELQREASVFDGTGIALFQLEIPLETVEAGLSLAKAAGALTMLDPAPVAALSDGLLAQVDILTPNLKELASLSGVALTAESEMEAIESACRSLMARGAGSVLAKLGERGALLVAKDEVLRFEAFKVTAVDCTAAGDCFNAAFAVALSKGKSQAQAGRFACAAAALSVTKKGAQASAPSLAEVERLLGR